MFEMPEMLNFSKQINETLKGKKIKKGTLGNSPHKFVWYNRTHKEFEKLVRGKKVGKSYARGRWLFIPLEPDYVLVFGECGGKVLHHQPGAKVPKKYHLFLSFDDGSFLTATTQMWGAFELHKKGKEHEGKYVKGMKTTPVEKGFTFGYFEKLVNSLSEKKSAKGLLTQDQLIPGLGNSIAQDILFLARLNPKHPVETLTKKQKKRLYDTIVRTVKDIADKGGRYDEYDLFGEKGKYVRLMDRNAAGKPCPECGTTVEKIQYLGGACYFCPSCQK
jgi:formamidopyrimidine-DNA glycosylase